MTGAYNPQFSQFAMINLFGWKSRKDELSGPDGEALMNPKDPMHPDNPLRDLEMARHMLFYIDRVKRRNEELEAPEPELLEHETPEPEPATPLDNTRSQVVAHIGQVVADKNE